MLNFLPILPQEIICVFNYISLFSSCSLPMQPRKPIIYQKIPFYQFTSLKSAFFIGHLSPFENLSAEIDPERALSCPRRASYEAERGLMLP